MAPRPAYAVHAAGAQAVEPLGVPPLLARYLALGARVCGEPAHDRAFGTLDLFVLLDRESAVAQQETRAFFDAPAPRVAGRSTV